MVRSVNIQRFFLSGQLFHFVASLIFKHILEQREGCLLYTKHNIFGLFENFPRITETAILTHSMYIDSPLLKI